MVSSDFKTEISFSEYSLILFMNTSDEKNQVNTLNILVCINVYLMLFILT